MQTGDTIIDVNAVQAAALAEEEAEEAEKATMYAFPFEQLLFVSMPFYNEILFTLSPISNTGRRRVCRPTLQAT